MSDGSATALLDVQGFSHQSLEQFTDFHAKWPDKPVAATECCGLKNQVRVCPLCAAGSTEHSVRSEPVDCGGCAPCASTTSLTVSNVEQPAPTPSPPPRIPASPLPLSLLSPSQRGEDDDLYRNVSSAFYSSWTQNVTEDSQLPQYQTYAPQWVAGIFVWTA
jgi:hypothetical protein